MYKLPENFYEDILVTALEGGSNYWIDYIKAANPPKPREMATSIWVSYRLNDGKTVFINADGVQYGLTKPKLTKGIKLWVKNHPKQVHLVDGELDAGSIDAGDADAILQYALFGELVYG